MRKLKLNVEAITVESFQTQSKPAMRGTVAGHDTVESACPTACWTQCPSGCLTQCDASDCTACNPTNAADCTWYCPGTGTGGGGGGTETDDVGVRTCGTTCLEETA
jgi:hypothetical protein